MASLRPLIHRGWQVSPYTAKTRAYLKYKKTIPFVDEESSILSLFWNVGRSKVGRVIMPTVQLNDDTFLQDSSSIIDSLEKMDFADSNLLLTSKQHITSKTRVASALIELFADEWLSMAILHYRWNKPIAADFAIGDFARAGFPWLPSFVGRKLAESTAKQMQVYMPGLGVSNSTGKLPILYY